MLKVTNPSKAGKFAAGTDCPQVSFAIYR